MKTSHILLLTIILSIFSACQKSDSEWIKIDSIPVDSITMYNIDSIFYYNCYLPNFMYMPEDDPFYYTKDFSEVWLGYMHIIDNAEDFEFFTTLKSTDYSIDFSKNIFVFCEINCNPIVEPYFHLDSYLEYRYDMGDKYYRYTIKVPTQDANNGYCVSISLEAWNIYPKTYLQTIKDIYYLNEIVTYNNSTLHE